METSTLKQNLHTILIIDDDKNIRDLFKINLERLGYQVILASNSNDALQHFNEPLDNKKPIDIVIIDLSLPGDLNGKDIAIEIKKLSPKVRTIVSSGNTESPEMLYCHKHGFNAAVEKNFNRENLKQVLNSVLENN